MAPDELREAVAQSLLDRFIERGKMRCGGQTFKDGTKIAELPRSYRLDFEKDADAAIRIVGEACAEVALPVAQDRADRFGLGGRLAAQEIARTIRTLTNPKETADAEA